MDLQKKIDVVREKLKDDIYQEEFRVIVAINTATGDTGKQNKVLRQWESRKERMIADAIKELGPLDGPRLEEIEKDFKRDLFPCRGLLKG